MGPVFRKGGIGRTAVRLLMMTFIGLLLACPAFSANLQKVYTTRDEIYQRVDTLCRSAGVLGPSNFSPLTARGLEIAMERIDTRDLNPSQLAEYNSIMEEIGTRAVVFQHEEMGIELDARFDLHGNIADYEAFDYSNNGLDAPGKDMRNDFIVPFRYERPFGIARLNFFYADNLSLEGELFLANNNHHLYESSLGWAVTMYQGRLLTFLSDPEEGADMVYNNINLEQPYRIGLSAGNNYFSAIVGRFPHSIGSGITGNLLVGDNFNYQELATLSFLNNYFTYNISVTRFDSQLSTTGPDSDGDYMQVSRNDYLGEQNFRVVHHFDVNLFDRLRLNVDLATLFRSSTAFDLRFFYPFMIQHDLNNYTNELQARYFDEANNMMAFSAELTFLHGFSLYFQFLMDQAQTRMEQNGVPSASGTLLNLRYSRSMPSGTLNLWIETVYTSPYLYLNGKYDAEKGYLYDLDYIVGYHGRLMPDYGYSGYVYGPDSTVYALGFDFTTADRVWSFGASLMYRVLGLNRLRHYSNGIDDTVIDMGDSLIGDKGDMPEGGWDGDAPTGTTETIEHLIQFKGDVSYTPFDWMEIYSQFGANLYYNYDNDASKDGIFLPQLVIGVTFSLPVNYKTMV